MHICYPRGIEKTYRLWDLSLGYCFAPLIPLYLGGFVPHVFRKEKKKMHFVQL